MLHETKIRSLLISVMETKIFPKFIFWLLSDPKYGTINQTEDKTSIKTIQRVIKLYKKWIDTGVKLDHKIWQKALVASNGRNAESSATGAILSAINYPHPTTNIQFRSVAWIVDATDYTINKAVANGIPRSEVEKAQIDKLNDLIKSSDENGDDGLYTWEDYEKDIEKG